jgi:hypothetical protein
MHSAQVDGILFNDDDDDSRALFCLRPLRLFIVRLRPGRGKGSIRQIQAHRRAGKKTVSPIYTLISLFK